MRQFVAAGKIPRSAKVFPLPSVGHLPRYQVDTKNHTLLGFRLETWARARGGGIRNAAVVDCGGVGARPLYHVIRRSSGRGGRARSGLLTKTRGPGAGARRGRLGAGAR